MKKKASKKKVAKKTAKKVTKKKVTKAKVAKKSAKKKTTKQKTAKKAAKKVTKKAAKKVTKKAAKKVTKKKTAKKVAKKTAKKVAKKAAKKVTKKAAKKVTKKVAKKASNKKVEKKVAKKKIAKKTTAKKAAPAPKKKAGKKKSAKKTEEVVEVEVVETEEDDEVVEASKSGPVKSDLDGGDEPDLSDVVLTGKKKKKAEEVIKEKLAETVVETAEGAETNIKNVLAAIKVSDFYSSDSDECLERGCDNPATTLGYCRYHYIANWKDIKTKQRVLEEGKLQDAIEELASKYPLRFIESMLTDLADEKTFFSVLKEMDIEGVEDSYDDIEDDGDDDQDIAFETKVTSKRMFEE